MSAAPTAPKLGQYFATLPDDDFVAHTPTLEQAYWMALQGFNLRATWIATACQKYGWDPTLMGPNGTYATTGAGPVAVGDNDGIKELRLRQGLANAYINQQNILALGERPAFQAQANNLDMSSQAQVEISGKCVEYMLTEAEFDKALIDAGLSDSNYGSGILSAQWDVSKGELVDVDVQAVDPETKQPLTFVDDTGQPKPFMKKEKRKTGAPRIRCFYPWQIVRSPSAQYDETWIILKEYVSRYELAGMFPDKADAIMNAPPITSQWGYEFLGFNPAVVFTEDMVTLNHFFHANTAAVPGGRYVGYVEGVCLWSRKCPIEEGLPIAEVKTVVYDGTSIGHPQGSDVVAMQEVSDDLVSAFVTNAMKFKDQPLFYHKDIQYDGQSNAYKLPDADSKPPQTVQYQQIPEGTMKLLPILMSGMQQTLGLNDAAMGRPESAGMSGVAIASLTQTAVKLQRPKQYSLEQAMTKTANLCLELAKKNATNGFMAEIAGATDEPSAKLFTQQDLQGIRKVSMIRTNPIMNQLAGKQAVADTVAKLPPALQRPWTEALITNSFEPLLEEDTVQTNLIRWENEELQAGRTVMANVDDNVKYHTQLHRLQRNKIQMMPDSPERTAALLAFNAHNLDHMKKWNLLDPMMADALGLPLPPYKQAALANQGALGAGGSALAAGAGGGKPNLPGSASPEAKPAQPAQPHPNMPQ